jgi:hypothetical protein
MNRGLGERPEEIFFFFYFFLLLNFFNYYYYYFFFESEIIERGLKLIYTECREKY